MLDAVQVHLLNAISLYTMVTSWEFLAFLLFLCFQFCRNCSWQKSFPHMIFYLLWWDQARMAILVEMVSILISAAYSINETLKSINGVKTFGWKKKQGFWTNAGIMYRPIINGLDNINSEIKFVLQFMLHAATCSTHVM